MLCFRWGNLFSGKPYSTRCSLSREISETEIYGLSQKDTTLAATSNIQASCTCGAGVCKIGEAFRNLEGKHDGVCSDLLHRSLPGVVLWIGLVSTTTTTVNCEYQTNFQDENIFFFLGGDSFFVVIYRWIQVVFLRVDWNAWQVTGWFLPRIRFKLEHADVQLEAWLHQIEIDLIQLNYPGRTLVEQLVLVTID